MRSNWKFCPKMTYGMTHAVMSKFFQNLWTENNRFQAKLNRFALTRSGCHFQFIDENEEIFGSFSVFYRRLRISGHIDQPVPMRFSGTLTKPVFEQISSSRQERVKNFLSDEDMVYPPNSVISKSTKRNRRNSQEKLIKIIMSQLFLR